MSKVFVFGSNREGKHGRGAAFSALKEHGAIYGQGEGIQGSSYGIPTKMTPYVPLSLNEIRVHVDKFLDFANEHPEHTFTVTRVGCGLAGYTDEQIAWMFVMAPENCELPTEWTKIYDECITEPQKAKENSG
jgi:hypothetical protein